MISLLSFLWLFDNYLTSTNVNFFALGVLAIMMLLMVFKFKILGSLIALIIALFSLYMILAVLSEFHDFPKVNYEALKLLFIGSGFCFLGFLSSLIMFYKYLIKSDDKHYFSFI